MNETQFDANGFEIEGGPVAQQEAPMPPPPAVTTIPPGGKMVEEVKRTYTPPPASQMQPMQIPAARGYQPPRGGIKVSAVQVINNAAEDAITDETKRLWTLHIHRRGPSIWPPNDPHGQRLLTGHIDEMGLMSVEEIERYLSEQHGHGQYVVELKDEQGKHLCQIVKSISSLIPPKIAMPTSLTSSGSPRTMSLSQGGMPVSGNPRMEADALMEKRTSVAVIQATLAETRAKNELEKEQRRMDRERQSELDAEERKVNAPEISALKTQMERDRTQTDNSLKDIMRTVMDVVKEMKHVEPKEDKTAAILESMRTSSENMMKMMMEQNKNTTTLIIESIKATANKPVDNSQMETVKMVMAENSKFAQMQMEAAKIQASAQAESAKAADAKHNKLMEMVFSSKLSEGDNKMDTFLKAMQMGEARTAKMYEAIERVREQSDHGGEEGINWGKIAESGLSALAGVLAMKQQQALPAPTTPQLQHRLPAAAPRVTPNVGMQPMVTPSVQHVQQQPQQRPDLRPIQTHVPPLAKPVSASSNVTPISDAVSPAPAQTPINEEPSPIHEHIGATPEVTVTPTPVADTIPHDEGVEQHLIQYVTAAMEQLKVDLKADPAEYEWVELALAKWNGDFLAAIAAVPDGVDRDQTVVAMINAKCEPSTWSSLATLFYPDDGSQSRYTKFVASIHELIEEIRGKVAA